MRSRASVPTAWQSVWSRRPCSSCNCLSAIQWSCVTEHWPQTGSPPLASSSRPQTQHAFGGGHPAHDFAITTIQRKRHANPFSVVASQLQSVRAPTRVTFLDGHFTLVLPGVHWLVALPKQQQAFVAHHAIDPLVINPLPINSQPSPYAPVAISGSVLDHARNGLLGCVVVGQGWRLSAIGLVRLAVCLGSQVAA